MIRLKTIPDAEPAKPPPMPAPAERPAANPAKAKKAKTEEMTPAQMRAGRALLNWSQKQLALSAGIGLASVNNYERGESDPRMGTVAKAERVMASVGVVFMPPGDGKGEGVRFEAPPHARPADIDPPKPPEKKAATPKPAKPRRAKAEGKV